MEAPYLIADRQFHYLSQKLCHIMLLLLLSMNGLHTQAAGSQNSTSTDNTRSKQPVNSTSSNYTQSTQLLHSSGVGNTQLTSSLDLASAEYEQFISSLDLTSAEYTQSTLSLDPTDAEYTQSTLPINLTDMGYTKSIISQNSTITDYTQSRQSSDSRSAVNTQMTSSSNLTKAEYTQATLSLDLTDTEYTQSTPSLDLTSTENTQSTLPFNTTDTEYTQYTRSLDSTDIEYTQPTRSQNPSVTNNTQSRQSFSSTSAVNTQSRQSFNSTSAVNTQSTRLLNPVTAEHTLSKQSGNSTSTDSQSTQIWDSSGVVNTQSTQIWDSSGVVNTQSTLPLNPSSTEYTQSASSLYPPETEYTQSTLSLDTTDAEYTHCTLPLDLTDTEYTQSTVSLDTTDTEYTQSTIYLDTTDTEYTQSILPSYPTDTEYTQSTPSLDLTDTEYTRSTPSLDLIDTEYTQSTPSLDLLDTEYTQSTPSLDLIDTEYTQSTPSLDLKDTEYTLFTLSLEPTDIQYSQVILPQTPTSTNYRQSRLPLNTISAENTRSKSLSSTSTDYLQSTQLLDSSGAEYTQIISSLDLTSTEYPQFTSSLDPSGTEYTQFSSSLDPIGTEYTQFTSSLDCTRVDYTLATPLLGCIIISAVNAQSTLLLNSVFGEYTQFTLILDPADTEYTQSELSVDPTVTEYMQSELSVDPTVTEYMQSVLSLDSIDTEYTQSALPLDPTDTELYQSTQPWDPTSTELYQSTQPWDSTNTELYQSTRYLRSTECLEVCKLRSTGQVCWYNSTNLDCSKVDPLFTAVPTPVGPNFIHLDFSKNAIVAIKEDDFAGMELLKTINLANNSISYIHQYAFKNLYRLEILHLEGNQLYDLDPSGFTFQHLVSLRWLYLQNNNITKVNKYSFLTMAASSNLVSVNLEHNPVQCGCDIWALREWEQSQTVMRIQLNLGCDNDEQKRSYKDVEDDVFGLCNSTQDGIFSKVQKCKLCVGESTNFKCSVDREISCDIVPQMVCQKTVTWNNYARNMLISNKCVRYQDCLGQEAYNSETCGLGFQSNGIVDCSFCCRDETCSSDTIGGRTKDFTFYLMVMNTSLNTFSAPMYLNWTNSIANKIPSALSSIKVGLDVNVYTSIPEQNQNHQYGVVLQLHLTTFSNDTEESVESAILKDLHETIFYENLDSLTLTLSLYFEGMKCNSLNPVCPLNMSCVQVDGKTRCLCDNSSFYNAPAKVCSPLSELQVKNLSWSSTTNTVTLTWTAKKYGTRVSYTIQPSPNEGQWDANSISVSGGIWTGLVSGSEYNFTVISSLTTEFYNKTVMSSISGVWTKLALDMECNVSNALCGANLNCAWALNTSRCLCDNSSFYAASTNACLSLTELAVKKLFISSRTNDTVILTWTANKHGTNVSYIIQPLPYKGHMVENSLNDSGGVWTGLDPGTYYNFTVRSVLPAGDIYAVTSKITGVWTKFAHGMACDISADLCTTGLNCTPNLHGIAQCLCDNSSFYVNTTKACLPLTELAVKNLSTFSITNDTVFLTWTVNKHGTNVSYTIQPSPYKGHTVANSVDHNGGVWTGLDPGTQYNFTVRSVLSADDFYAQVSSEITGVWTKFAHGMACDISADLCTTGLNCTPNLHGIVTQCLCDNSSFYVNTTKACLPLAELAVKNLSTSSITNDTVFLTWTANKHGTNVSYIIQPFPYKGHIVANSLNDSGGVWTSINPGTYYDFTVGSVLPEDDFYAEKYVSSTITEVRTKEAKNVTLNLSYITYNDTYQPFMADPNSPEYLREVQRIITGVKSVLAKTVEIVTVTGVQFIPKANQTYEVLLQIEVTVFDIETVKKDINEAVQNSTQDSNSFFSKENLKSLEVSSNKTVSNSCPYSVTHSTKGTIQWEESNPGLINTSCLFSDQLENTKPLASRECLANAGGFSKWGEVNESLCITKDEAENPDFNKILSKKTNVTKENAKIVSSSLEKYTNGFENFTVENVSNALTFLEDLTSEEMLAQPNVATNVMNSVSNLINVNRKTLTESGASRRLLVVIDSVPNRVPLTEGKFKLMTTNLAVAAQKIDLNETQDIAVVTDIDSGMGQNDNMVSIDFITNSTESENRTGIMIPVRAILASLTSEDIVKLKRISFTVHRLDILFATIQNSERVQASRSSTASDSQPDVSYDIPKEKSNTTKINSQVISASIPGVKVQNLSSNITISFEHINVNATNARCVFWNESLSNGSGAWSGAGCGIVESFIGGTTCGCNHLTNFALLMDVYNEHRSLSDLDRKILSIISYVGCGISSFALLLTLITYSLLKQVTQYSLSDHTTVRRKLRRDNPSKILINLCLAMFLSNLVFLVGMQDYAFNNIASCKAVAVLMHYFLLSSLTWMAVEAFYMYLALVRVFKTYFTNFILKCVLVGWGVPLVIVAITLAVNTTDNYGFLNSGLCWLKNPAFYAAFVGPVCLILLLNLLTFTLVVKQLVSMSSSRLHKSEKNSTIQRLRGAVGVVILLGLSWIFAIFAIDQASVAFYYLFAVFNSLQGLFIFIFYCLLKNEAVKSLKRSLPCFEEYGETSKSYSNSRGAGVTKTADHRMAEHKSNSSKYNTKSTDSTITGSRKDSCFSTLSNNGIFDETENDVQGYTETEISRYKEAVAFPEQLSKVVRNGLPSYTSKEANSPVKNFDNIVQDCNTMNTNGNITLTSDNSITHFDNTQDTHSKATDGNTTLESDNPTIYFDNTQDTHTKVTCANTTLETDNPTMYFDSTLQDTLENTTVESDNSSLNFDYTVQDYHTNDLHQNITPERQNSTSSEDDSLKLPDSLDSTAALYADLPIQELVPASLSLPQVVNDRSVQMESPPDNAKQPDIPEYSYETDGRVNPSFTPFTAEGEIDYSHTASVRDIRRKFEWSMSENSDKDVTKI